MIKKLLTLLDAPAEKSNVQLFFRKSFLLLIIVFGFNAQAQVSSYTSSHAVVTPAYSAIAGADLFTNTWDDVVSPAVNIGFTFNYNGKDYAQCYVSSNGFITFGSAPLATEYFPLSSSAAYEGAIAVYGRNLFSNSSAVSYLTQGSVGSRTFTVQYSAVRGTGTLGGTYNMQVILYEATGVVELKYNTVTVISAAISAAYGQIGLRGLTNQDFNNKQFNANAVWPDAGLNRGTVNTSTNTDMVVTRTNTVRSIQKVHTITYTPPTCFAPKNPLAQPINITYNSATIDWTASTTAPAGGYDYLVTTTAPTNMNVAAGFPNALTTPIGSVGAGITTATIPSGLAASTLYYIYVRSKCGTDSGWSVPGTFRTLCAPFGDPAVTPYTQNFLSAATGTTPPSCNYINTTGATNTGSGSWYIADPLPSPAADYGFPTRHVRIRSNPSGDPINTSAYVPEGFYLDSGKSYRVSYLYGASAEFSVTAQTLQLAYGAKPFVAALTNVLATHANFKGGPYTNVVNFSVPVSGVYYIGFIDRTPANNAFTLLDDITVGESSCTVPGSPSSGGVTAYTATIGWTAPAPAPGSGYQYYLNTTGVLPSNPAPIISVAPGTTLANLSGLAANTTYYWWVRSNCGNGDTSPWTAMSSFHTATAPVLATYCTPSFPSGVESICRVIFNGIDNASTCGLTGPAYTNYTTISAAVNRSSTYPITVYGNTDGNFTNFITVFIDFNQDGDFTDSGETFQLGTITNCANCAVVSNITIPATATLGYTTMRVMKKFSSAATSCNSSGFGEAEDYSLNIRLAAPALVLTATEDTICAGLNTSVSITAASAANYDSYSWSPSGVTGTAPNFNFSPTVTTLYTLTGLNTSTFQSTSTTFLVKVNEAPTAVVVTPATSTICQGQTTQMLSSSGGIVNGSVILTESFDTGASGWSTTNTGSGGDLAEGLWYLYEDGDVVFGFTAVHSNDNTGFAAVNSDFQGSGTTTNSSLVSPVMDLTGYTTASIGFWQYYRYWNGGEYGVFEVSTDGGANYLPALYTVNTTTGTARGFVRKEIDLTPYVGQTNFRFRFRYFGTFDYGWAIDNVAVTGSASSAVVWTPATGLYTDAAGNTAYVAGSGSKIVYARPDTTQIYTATVTTPGGTGCTSTTNVTVTVTPIIVTEPTPLDQTVCSGLPTQDIVMTIPVGASVTKWQYATNAAFTTPTDLSITTATLTPAQIFAAIGTLAGDHWFRAVVNGCGIKNSRIVKITVPSTTWNGSGWSNLAPDASKMAIFTGPATIGSNLTACAIVVKNGAVVTVASTATLTIQHGVDVATGASSLVFENNSSLLQNSTSNVINKGDVIYKRISTRMVAYDYTYWSSPVKTQMIGLFSPDTRSDKYFWWNPNPGVYEWETIAAPGTTPMTPGLGYIIRAPYYFDNTPTFDPRQFTGIPNNGDIVVPTYVISATQNLNLIGNPYPSALDAELLMKDASNAAALGGGTTFYFWTHNSPIAAHEYASNDYATYNYTGGTGVTVTTGVPGIGNSSAPTRYIAAGQSFMAACITTGSHSVTFKNTMRVGSNNANFYKSANTAEIEKNRVWLDLSNTQGAYKQILVGYIENATNGFDNGYDGESLDGGGAVNFYSLLEDKQLTIQGRAAAFDNTDRVPLGYRAVNQGSYTINLSDKDGFFIDQDVYLEDRLLNVVHDLKQGSYTFVTEAGVFDSRFVLRYTNEALSVSQPLFNENAVVVYKDKNGINFKTSGFTMSTIKIYDVNGRELMVRNKIDSDSAVISNLTSSQQVLLIKIISSDGIVVNKKIVF